MLHATSHPRRVVASLAALALTSTLAACGGSDAPETADSALSATFLGGAPSFSYTEPQLIDSLGIDEDNGLDMTYEGSATNPPLILSALLAGDVDVANSSAPTVLEAAAEGKDLVIVGCTVNTIAYLVLRKDVVDKLGVSPDAPIADRIKALKGLRLSSTPTGSTFPTVLSAMLTSEGLDLEKDVEVIGSGDPAAIVAGVKQGRFDGAFYGPASLEGNVATGEAVVWIDVPRGDLDGIVQTGMNGVAIMSRKVVESNPRLVEAVQKTLTASADVIFDDPDRAGKALKDDWFPKMPQDVFDYVWGQNETTIPREAKCGESEWDAMVALQSSVTGKSYEAVGFDDIVLASAQAN